MHVTIGKHWVIELDVRISRVCRAAAGTATRDLAQSPVATNRLRKDREHKWERDKLAGRMLSGWN